MSILIIDDEENILKTISRNLDLEGITNTHHTSAVKALEEHTKNLYSILLTDIRMPEMNGVEVIKRAKEINPAMIIFVMTGYGSLANLLDCLEKGAVEYFFKPFEDINYVVDHLKQADKRFKRWKTELIKLKNGVNFE